MDILVTEDMVPDLVKTLFSVIHLSFDTETTGLRYFHGHKVFCFVIHDGLNTYFFKENYELLNKLWAEPNRVWFMHNSKFDLHMMRETYGVDFGGTIWDTEIGARLEYNSHMSYSLENCAERIGLAKSNAVEEYIKEHKLSKKVDIPGKKTRVTEKYFHLVPEPIIFEYACQDARVTYQLGQHQRKKLAELGALLPKNKTPLDVMRTETACLKVTYDMEKRGVKIDREFVNRAIEIESNKMAGAEKNFYHWTQAPFIDSDKAFAEIFSLEKERWQYTEKGNPSFKYEVLKTFTHPAAAEVVKHRDAKSRLNFFQGFLYHMDANDFVHPNFNQARTITGRLSSSNPNFQNLTNDDELSEEEMDVAVRRALIPPSPDYFWASIDYKQQEYALMLDYSGEMELIEAMRSGADVHEATAKLMGVTRRQAKTLNFMLLYGGGAAKLAASLGISLDEAKRLKDLYFAKLPKVQTFIRNVIAAAETRGYLVNWAGRRLFFERAFAYKGPNAVIQSGGADIMKQALVKIHTRIRHSKSYIALSVHDEVDLCVHKDEAYLVDEVREIMESIYPAKNLPLKCSVEYSWSSLGELQEKL